MPLRDDVNSVLEVFSGRKQGCVEGPEQNEISQRLRGRILILIRDLFSGKRPTAGWSSASDYTHEYWADLRQKLEQLHGRPIPSSASPETYPLADLFRFVETCEPAELFDIIELTFRTSPMWRVLNDENELVDAINEIFRVEDAPYQLTHMAKVEEQTSDGRFGLSGAEVRIVAYPRVIRVDDQPTHSEGIQPALSSLAAPYFEAANLEFREALDEYRNGHYGDCLTKCCSSFESVMKSLCKRNNWPFDEKKDTASPLLKTVLAQTKLDPFFEQPLLLIATMRNRLSSSHGGGPSVRIVERHIAQYAITSTAAAILLLVHSIEEQSVIT